MKILVSLFCLLMSSIALSDPYKAGDTPFDLVGKTSAGQEIKVSDYKGKVVIVSFWASWCGPCKKELPILARIQKSATPENLQVISINIDEDRRLFKKLEKALALGDMILVSDPKKRVGKKYGVEGIPHMVIINAEGKVASVHIGYSEEMLPALVDEINEIYRSGKAES